MLICENSILFVCLLVEPCSYFTLVVIYLFHGSSKITLTTCTVVNLYYITGIIIHQTHYEKSDWSRAFNQFTIACELYMINASQKDWVEAYGQNSKIRAFIVLFSLANI